MVNLHAMFIKRESYHLKQCLPLLASSLLTILILCHPACTSSVSCPVTHSPQTEVSCPVTSQGLPEVSQHIRTLIESNLESISDACKGSSVTSTPPLTATASTSTTAEPTLPNTTPRQNSPANGTFQNPASSCKYVPQEQPSGFYWINGSSVTQQYCDMTRSCCDSVGGWMRVANMNVTDMSQQCPPGFKLVTSPRRSCGRPDFDTGCHVSTIFPVFGVEYSRVCGRVIGYQFGDLEAFFSYDVNRPNISDNYVDGISITYGRSPRNHIWTFAAARDEAFHFDPYLCPCHRPDGTFFGSIPPFVGDDYFCETGSRTEVQRSFFYSEDPLWDGQGCGEGNTCCDHPLYFCKQLSQPTRDDIELRLCASEISREGDTPLEIIEIYIQ